MSTTFAFFLGAVCVLTLTPLLVGLLRHRDIVDAQAAREGMAEEIADAIGAPRYEVVLSDWGPDFTGRDGTLPRWRWVVVDADREVRAVIGQPLSIGTMEMPHMLGNAHDPLEALVAAAAWIDRDQNPLVNVVMGEKA